MKNKDLVFDRSCHVLYSKQCEKAIKKRISKARARKRLD